MISVQNRRQQSNGNRIILFCFVAVFTFSSCGLFSGGSKGNSKGNSTTNTKEEVKVDTVQWTKLPEDKFPPIKSDTKVTEKQVDSEYVMKDQYRVAAIVPFQINRMDMNVESVQEIRNLKYLHYYAGMQMAMEDLEQEDISITLDVFDSKENLKDVKFILNNKLSSNTDAIMGPLKKDILIELAKFGKENKVPVISPWYSSQSIANENPNYIQLTPFLIDHYKALTQHALSSFDPENIYLVGRTNSKDVNRFKYFQEEAYKLTGEENALQEFVFYQDSLTHEFEIIKRIIRNQIDKETGERKPTVFIIPNFSSRESQYIYDLLRRINVEKLDNEVYVYGMPVLYDMDKITYEYYTNLNMRIAMSRYTQKSSVEASLFSSRYFNEYNDFPKQDAFEGYDNMMFLGRALKKYGTGFIANLDKDETEYLSTRYNIKPVSSSKDPESIMVDYFENKNLRIIQYIENEFSIIK